MDKISQTRTHSSNDNRPVRTEQLSSTARVSLETNDKTSQNKTARRLSTMQNKRLHLLPPLNNRTTEPNTAPRTSPIA